MQVVEYTMADYIAAIANETITMKSLQYQDIVNTGTDYLILNEESVLRLYKNDLRADSVMLVLNNEEKRKYCFKPWTFCLDTYGISDLWRELLDLNQIRSFAQFNYERIRVFSPEIIRKIKTALKLEEDVINEKSAVFTQKVKEATLA